MNVHPPPIGLLLDQNCPESSTRPNVNNSTKTKQISRPQRTKQLNPLDKNASSLDLDIQLQSTITPKAMGRPKPLKAEPKTTKPTTTKPKKTKPKTTKPKNLCTRPSVPKIAKTKKRKPPTIAWVANQDNQDSYNENAPNFKGTLAYNFSQSTNKTPLYYFKHLFTDIFLDSIAKETTRYAIQSGDHSFSTSGKEMLLFLTTNNMLMTIYRFPSYRMYWSSNDFERQPIT